MEEENESSGVVGMVPLALSILALVLGAAGLYFGLTANQRLSPVMESMEAGNTSTARLEESLGATETQIAELSARVDDIKKALDRVRLYGSQNERTLKQLASGVQDNRKELVKLADGLNKALAGGAVQAPASSGRSAPSSGAASRPTTAAEGTYVIQSGDSFGKIAKKLGIDLQALLDANPDKDPRRLNIGTVINLPTN